MRALVVIPTYNERETLPVVVNSVMKHKGFDVLVVDDGSPDGTAQVVREMMSGGLRVFLIERASKLGLGTAYVEGFRWGLGKGYDYFIEMDADKSHDPEALPLFVEEMRKGLELTIGSRYLDGEISVVGWDFKRLLLSKFGNFYASRILGVQLTDLTSGFRCYSRKALEWIDLAEVHSNGYAFQIEMAYRIAEAGGSVGEMPIIFYERESGESKMSRKIIREAVFLPWRLRLGRIRRDAGRRRRPDFGYHFRTILGFLVLVIGVASGSRLGWWLGTKGDIIELIHKVKMGLPDLAWVVMKIGLSILSVFLFLGFFGALAVVVFAGGRRKRTS